MRYDSRIDTQEHIRQVYINMSKIRDNLEWRAAQHDQSKLVSPEVEIFDAVTPKLKELEYGSTEYFEQLEVMGEALDHHYAHNSHHPQHHHNGIKGMNLLDQLEMLADWYAATKRMKDGDLRKSIEQNAERFGYDEVFKDQLLSTAKELGWI